MKNPTLSILICSLPNRLKKFSTIEELTKQAEGKPVEILYLGDNKQMTVGEKRNRLLNMAKGEYVAFVDDDDRVAPEYLDNLLYGIKSGADVICFRVFVTGYGRPKGCLYSLRYTNGQDGKFYYRQPNHLMAWSRMLCLPFLEINSGEDSDWGKRMALQSQMTENGFHEHQIEKVLYYYDFNTNGTEAQR